MPEPYLVELACPDNAPATTILPNGQHYTRDLDPATGALKATIKVWDHDVDAMKAAGFRHPDEKAAAEAVHATFWVEPSSSSDSGAGDGEGGGGGGSGGGKKG